VDAYNAVFALYRMPIGADDLDRIKPPLAFRSARPTDTFIALGDQEGKADPPKAGEIVYADAEKCLCRRWNWYQDARSATGLRTTRAVLTVQSLSDDEAQLRIAVAKLADLIVACGGSRVNWSIARADSPRVSVSLP
jgi:DNA/RNA-binding domain of Phe-tRNA-synthetase-like protein